MSPIFNQAVLRHLSTSALNALKYAFIEALADGRLTTFDRECLRTSLASIALMLRQRTRPEPFGPSV